MIHNTSSRRGDDDHDNIRYSNFDSIRSLLKKENIFNKPLQKQRVTLSNKNNVTKQYKSSYLVSLTSTSKNKINMMSTTKWKSQNQKLFWMFLVSFTLYIPILLLVPILHTTKIQYPPHDYYNDPIKIITKTIDPQILFQQHKSIKYTSVPMFEMKEIDFSSTNISYQLHSFPIMIELMNSEYQHNSNSTYNLKQYHEKQSSNDTSDSQLFVAKNIDQHDYNNRSHLIRRRYYEKHYKLHRQLPSMIIEPIMLEPDYGNILLHDSEGYKDMNTIDTYHRMINPTDNRRYNRYRKMLFQKDYKNDVMPWYDRYEDYFDGYDDINGKCIRPSWSYSYYPNCMAFHDLVDDSLRSSSTTLPSRAKSSSSLSTRSSSSVKIILKPMNNSYTGPITVKYLGSGAYRQSWMFQIASIMNNRTSMKQQDKSIINSNVYETETIVLKRLLLQNDNNFDVENFEKIKMEALLMEELGRSGGDKQTHSFIGTIYGHCGTSTMVEYANDVTHSIVPHVYSFRGRISQEELDELENEHQMKPYPLNYESFYLDQKLDIALSMAKGLSQLHGFRYGTVVHEDIHPDQWLLTNDGRIILNDMNNAEFLRYNKQKESYCTFQSGYIGGFRSPEEYILPNGGNVNESADIWPMGNLLFSLLTGLFPYYNIFYENQIQQMIYNNKTKPYIDPLYANNSYIEQQILHIMNLCYQFNPNDRIAIFDIVQLLEETKRQYHEQQQQHQEESQHQLSWYN